MDPAVMLISSSSVRAMRRFGGTDNPGLVRMGLTSPCFRRRRMNLSKQWLFLSLAIVSEVVATSALKSAEGFTRLWPSAVVAAGYTCAFYFLSIALKTIPVGVAYAVWSGLGTTLIVLIGWAFLGQKLDFPALAGILLIVLGVVILNLFSKSTVH